MGLSHAALGRAQRHVRLRAPHPPAACAARIAAALQGADAPLAGWIRADRLRLRRRTRYRNAMQRELHATLTACPEGTLLVGMSGVSPAVVAFLLVWFGALGAVGALMAVAMVTGHFVPAIPGPEGQIVPLLVPTGMAVVGWAGVSLARRVGLRDHAWALDHLCALLDASPA